MELQEILSTIFQLVIIPLLTVLTGYAVKWINAKANEIKAKTQDQYAQKYIDMLNNTITSTVIAINQTYVDELKEHDKFDIEAQHAAFEKVYNMVIATLTEEAQYYLSEAIADLPTYITTQIEKNVNFYKKVKE